MAEEVVLEKTSEQDSASETAPKKDWKKDGRLIFGVALLAGVVFLLITTLLFESLTGVTPKNVIIPEPLSVCTSSFLPRSFLKRILARLA